MNRQVQPGFTSQESTKFFWRSSHESALSLHRHARPGPTLSDRNWLAQKLRYFSPALETIRMSVLLRWTTLLGCLLFRLHRVHFTRTGLRVHSSPGCRTPRKYEPGEMPTKSMSAYKITV